MKWDGPLITDSGGFQVFSLGAAFGKGVTKFAKGEEGDVEKDESLERDVRPTLYSKEIAAAQGKLCVVDDEGVTFTSHIDGSMHRFTAERSIEIQQALGADIIVAFDECTSPTADYTYQKEALERTHKWAKRSVMAHRRDYIAVKKQGIYGVVQGGRHLDLRQASAHEMARLDFDGFGIGGSFSKEDLGESLRVVNEILPSNKPRHLLGIGEPEDIFNGVENGCDTFDALAAPAPSTPMGKGSSTCVRLSTLAISESQTVNVIAMPAPTTPEHIYVTLCVHKRCSAGTSVLYTTFTLLCSLLRRFDSRLLMLPIPLLRQRSSLRIKRVHKSVICYTAYSYDFHA
jgi:queuine tRNA-ribosyltransferase